MVRNFLNDITIVGAMLISREGKILNYSISGLLKWCDWILLMMDNEDRQTRKIAQAYKNKYGDRIRIAHSGFPRATKALEEKKSGLFIRFKRIQGPVRETVFQYLRECVKKGEKVDILLFPDADEVFTDYLPELVKRLHSEPKKFAISMKPIDVYKDFKILRGRSMTGHIRIMKFFSELTAVPYRTTCNYLPLKKIDKLSQSRAHIHLAALTVDKMNWRKKHWKAVPKDEEPLWILNQDVREMTPIEILDAMVREPNTIVKEYNIKHNL